MQKENFLGTRSAWSGWADFLHRHRLGSLAAWGLEAAGPLAVLGAQMIYIASPLLRPAMTENQVKSLAGLLEDRDEALAFSDFLRKEESLD